MLINRTLCACFNFLNLQKHGNSIIQSAAFLLFCSRSQNFYSFIKLFMQFFNIISIFKDGISIHYLLLFTSILCAILCGRDNKLSLSMFITSKNFALLSTFKGIICFFALAINSLMNTQSILSSLYQVQSHTVLSYTDLPLAGLSFSFICSTFN